MKFTPDKITRLKPDQVFVFGSNTQGRHGKGAALVAKDKFGAIYGQAYGNQGQSYAIITKELRSWKPKVSLDIIYKQLLRFFDFAISNSDKEFLVVKLGCSLAGYKVEEIRDLFQNAIKERGNLPENVILPKEFHNLNKENLF